jgi:hypothetical protein
MGAPTRIHCPIRANQIGDYAARTTQKIFEREFGLVMDSRAWRLSGFCNGISA